MCEGASLTNRSRPGIGAHAWVFFTSPVPAETARRLGAGLLREAMSLSKCIDLASYDRLFPSQELLPLGGVGNLIAAPLFRPARDKGATSSWTPLSAQAGVSAELRQRRVAVNRLGSRLCQWLAVSVMPRRAGSTSGTANLGFAPAATTRMTNPAASSACRALARPPITAVRPPRPEISDRA
jgi:hypothetical protein